MLLFPGSVKFIDYEYAGYNYQAFDIGNHFNEFAGKNDQICSLWKANVHVCARRSLCFYVAGLNEVDYSHYPDRAFQLQWLRSYLEAYKEHKGSAAAVTDGEVETLYVQVNQFALVRCDLVFSGCPRGFKKY